MIVNQNLKSDIIKFASESNVEYKNYYMKKVVTRMESSFNEITKIVNELSDIVSKEEDLVMGIGWILDNFYKVEEQIQKLKASTGRREKNRLGILTNTSYKGIPQICHVAKDLIESTNGNFDEDVIIDFLKTYQNIKIFSIAEIWSFNTILILILTEKINEQSNIILKNQKNKMKALSLSLDNPETVLKTVKQEIGDNPSLSPIYIETLAKRLMHHNKGFSETFDFLNSKLKERNSTIEKTISLSNLAQSSTDIYIANLFTSLNKVSKFNWNRIFEEVSVVEYILKDDPAETYAKMDFDSRNYYRSKLERVAQKHNIEETKVASTAIKLSNQNISTLKRNHVGYYLVGKGVDELLNNLNIKPKPKPNKEQLQYLYIIAIAIFTVVAYALFWNFFKYNYDNIVVSLLLSFLLVIISNDLFITIFNYLLQKFSPINILPRLDLSQRIPDDYKTFIVIPTMITSEDHLDEIFEKMEEYFLGNKSDNLYLALLGEFTDSDTEFDAQDSSLIRVALNKAKELNKKYADASPIFYYFQRKRQFNQKQEKWMCWERKRGSLTEFNNLILGEKNTSHIIASSNISHHINKIRYIITLDEDTNLPIDTAHKLIGTIAHPLNEAIYDDNKGRVVDGFGVIQPNVSINLRSSNVSLFTKIFGRASGASMYVEGLSDLYQDVFNSGVFYGKGIYNLEVFSKILNKAMPQNKILSHDLLEGTYINAGYVSDINVVDTYPSKYMAYLARLHRWIRGDWQLICWLAFRVRDSNDVLIKNPISLLSRWKILDNLRRSLISICLYIFIIGIFLFLPSPLYIWIIIALSVVFIPLFLETIDNFIFKKYYTPHPLFRKRKKIKFNLKGSLQHNVIQLIYLPFEATIVLSAIITTLYRVAVSKKNLLEWTTSSINEMKLKRNLKNLINKMKIIYIELSIFLMSVYFVRKELFIPALIISFIWGLSPLLIYILDEKEGVEIKPTSSEISTLRKDARKIWSYFEDFSKKSTNYLPPDNYQKYPPKNIAERTSPTNIGLGLLALISARDMGFVSITRTIRNIKQMLSTIDKLEKWHGNLYNWYDTRNLSILRPRYVSSVDSGNYLGYLMTLKQSLIQYKNMSVIDDDVVQGLKETFELEQEMTDETEEIFNDFGTIEEKSSSQWIQFLNQCKSKVNTSSIKTSSMIDELISEHSKYFTLIQYKEEKDLHKNPEFIFISNEIEKIKVDLSLPELRQYYINLLNQIRQDRQESEEELRDVILIENKIKSITSNLAELIRDLDQMINIIDRLINTTEINKLYDYNKHLFSIGYDCEKNQMTDSYYDLLASESRTTSFIGIITKQVPVEHWYKLSRTYTLYNRNRALASWSGTMFEYFMPNLIMRNYEQSIFDETYNSVIQSQIEYGASKNKPWGVSESGYYFFDLDLNYQYKAFGVPNISFKRGLINDYVVSPYSTYLVLNFDKTACFNNRSALINEGTEGRYGLYEAIDYTKDRLSPGEDKKIVQSYMAHHLGMSLLSINNFINNNILQERFHENPVVKTGEILLAEKLPYKVLVVKEQPEKEREEVEIKSKDFGTINVYGSEFNTIPHCHLISNKNYHVMVTNTGFTYSKYKDNMITRFRNHTDQRYFGYTFYFKNTDDGKIWSIGSDPVINVPKKYEVLFSLNKVEISREDDDIDTHMEMWVSAEDNVEIRRITLMNKKSIPVTLEITSYAELVMTDQNSDLAHPAFNNLFISTEFDKDTESLIAVKKPRDSKEDVQYIFKTFSVTGTELSMIQYETSRTAFIGRGRTLSNPIALEKFLDNTEGVVLEPILSLRKSVTIQPHQKIQIAYSMGVAKSKSEAKELIEKYKNSYTINDQLKLSEIQAQVELSHLDLDSKALNLFQKMISQLIYLNPNRKKYSKLISNNTSGQDELWKYGISADNPIILLKIPSVEAKETLLTILKGKEYWSLKGLQVDLIILNSQEASYYKDLEEEVIDLISAKFRYTTSLNKIGVYVINNNQITNNDRYLLYASADIILDASEPDLDHQIEIDVGIKDLIEKRKFQKYQSVEDKNKKPIYELKYFNGYGGFNIDDSEYVIQYRENTPTPMPWINVVANKKFGFIISENGGGYTWAENSSENKLTPWLNDTIFNFPQEILYMKDETYGNLWSLTPEPLGKYIDYDICHGKGYSKFISESYGFENKLVVYASLKKSVKIYSVNLKNISDETRKLSSFFYVNPFLGGIGEKNNKFIITKMLSENIMTLSNPFNYQFPDRVMYISCSETIESYTGNKVEFNLKNLRNLHVLSNNTGGGFDPCGGFQISLELKPDEEKQFVFIIGHETQKDDVYKNASYFQNVENCNSELQKIRNHWKHILGSVQIKTPDNKIDTLINEYLPYQTLACRINARSAFYQVGGAYGFRDQLQDALNMLLIDPKIAKAQIILHASHQFEDGDVLHWWHPGDIEKGVRTRFADDLLWLPYAVAEYLLTTEDYRILDIKLPYVTGDELKEEQNEIYMTVGVSDYKETLYMHCLKAIDYALELGPHELPLMKGGDWNDGMNKVGLEGKGESIWLGWFLAHILKRFSEICMQKGDTIKHTEYLNYSKDITASIEKHGWDGSWYRRAYYDDGTPLGSVTNSECKIASLPQSWSVISGLGDKERSDIAMSSVNNHLILEDKGMILLFTPPFDKSKKNPGYIKSYAKGLRENGGQYTHAAAWVIYAYALLGEGTKAYELFEMLNPISHSRSFFLANQYKVEPYVMPADIYYVPPHEGRGGWTWYTGAAGWMYRVFLDGIIGLKIRGKKLYISPSVPNDWTSYSIKYRYVNTQYDITVISNKKIPNGITTYTLDNEKLQTDHVELVDDKKNHELIVEIN